MLITTLTNPLIAANGTICSFECSIPSFSLEINTRSFSINPSLFLLGVSQLPLFMALFHLLVESFATYLYNSNICSSDENDGSNSFSDVGFADLTGVGSELETRVLRCYQKRYCCSLVALEYSTFCKGSMSHPKRN